MAFTPTTGYGGTLTLTDSASGSGITFPVIRWSLQNPATILTYSNSLVGSHFVRASTFLDYRVTVEIDYDQTHQPFQSAVAVLPGTLVTNVNLIVSAASNDSWTISSMIVESVPMTLERAGKVTLSIQLAINGGTVQAPNNATPF